MSELRANRRAHRRRHGRPAPRRRRQADRGRAVRERPRPARHAVREGEGQPACPGADPAHRHVQGRAADRRACRADRSRPGLQARPVRRRQGHPGQGRGAPLRRGRRRRRRRDARHRRAGPSSSSRSSTSRCRRCSTTSMPWPPDAPLVHPHLGEYAYVEAAFTPQPGTNIANLTKLRKGDVEQGFAEAEWIVEREYTNPSRAARADGDPRRHRPVEGRRRRHHLVERAVAVHRAQPVLLRVQAAAQQGPGRHPARRRRVRRQGRHPPRTARRLPVAQGRRAPGQAAGHPRGGVQPAPLPQRADLPDQDRRPLRRHDHRPADDDVLGRRRLRRLRRQRHPGLRLLGRRTVRRSPTPGWTRTRSTRTSPTAPRTAASGTSSSSGASSGTWNSSPRRSGWTRSSSAGRTCCGRARPH